LCAPRRKQATFPELHLSDRRRSRSRRIRATIVGVMPDKLSQPEYLHLLFNHLPIVGLAVATLVTALALALRNRVATMLGLALMALLSLAAWPVMETGEDAYGRLRRTLDDNSRHALRQHMDLAKDWSALYYVTAGVATLGLVAAWRKPKWLGPAATLAVLLAIASLVAGVIIAEAGGQVRHPEFRPGGARPAPEDDPAQSG
jgi:hypothetical protein